jgi:hypothetical protein
MVIKSNWKWLGVFLAMAVVALVGMPLESVAQVVTSDGTNVVFAPAALTTPVITGIVAAIVAGTAIVVLLWGVSLVYKALRKSK